MPWPVPAMLLLIAAEAAPAWKLGRKVCRPGCLMSSVLVANAMLVVKILIALARGRWW